MRSLVAIITTCGFFLIGATFADTNSVAITNGVTCQYNIPDAMDAGPYQINAGTTFNTSITLSCRSSIATTIIASMSSDQYSVAKPAPRVTAGSQKVDYNLFLGLGVNQQNFGGTPYIHNFNFPSANVPAVVLTDNIPLVVRFPGGQWVPAGQYSDSIVITVDFQLAN